MQETESVRTHYLYPGTLFASTTPHVVTTVLGSCISICLYDPVVRIGGINHFLLPLWNGEGLPTPKYGNIATDKLIEKMLNLGCRKPNLQAKVFGGGRMWDSNVGLLTVGERNIWLAEKALAEHNIPIIGSDVGGNCGRKVIFETETGKVLMRRNKSSASEQAAAS